MHRSPPCANRRVGPTRRNWASNLALPALLLLAGCDLSFDQQEVHTRYDAATDTLEVLLIYEGLYPGSYNEDERLQKGVDALRRLLGGAREFMIVDWPLYWSLDSWRDEAREDLSNIDTRPEGPQEGDELRRREARLALSLYQHFSLETYGLFLHEGKLCGYQFIKVRDLQKAVRTGNRLIHEAVLDQQASGSYAEHVASGDLDQRTVDLMVARARSETPWFSLDQHGLKVDVPLSAPRCKNLRRRAVRSLKDLEIDDDDAPFIHLVAELSTAVRSIEFPGDSVVLTLGGPDPRHLDLNIELPESGDTAEFLQRVVAEGLPIDRELPIARVRELVKSDG